MKYFCKLVLLVSFLTTSTAFANDVIMATTEDLKEFDNLIAKDPKPGSPPVQGQTPPPPR